MLVLPMLCASCLIPRAGYALIHVPPVSMTVLTYVGLLELPSLPDLANLVVEAKTRGNCHLSKFDVSSAFNKYKLHLSNILMISYRLLYSEVLV
jgi:hypothetical protein